MYRDDITKIKKRVEKVFKAVEFIFAGAIIVSFIAVVIVIAAFFAKQGSFKAIKGNMDWCMRYEIFKNSYWNINIPFKIIQPFSTSMFSAKAAFLTCIISWISIKMSIIIYGIKQISDILKTILNDMTPFIMENVKRIKKLGCLIIIYSAAGDVLMNIFCYIFVTKIFSMNLENIDIIGVIIGGIILVIADIFKYGVFLQNEFDTTL